MSIADVYQQSKLAQLFYAGHDHVVKAPYNQYSLTVARVRFMTRSARKMLLATHRILERNNFEAVNRAAIAAAIGHPRMHRYDLKLMDELIKEKLIKVERVSLGKPEGNLVRGSEYRYSMDIETAWILSHARNPQAAASQGQRQFEPKAASNLPNRKQAAPIAYDWEKDLTWHERLIDWFWSLFGR